MRKKFGIGIILFLVLFSVSFVSFSVLADDMGIISDNITNVTEVPVIDSVENLSILENIDNGSIILEEVVNVTELPILEQVVLAENLSIIENVSVEVVPVIETLSVVDNISLTHSVVRLNENVLFTKSVRLKSRGKLDVDIPSGAVVLGVYGEDSISSPKSKGDKNGMYSTLSATDSSIVYSKHTLDDSVVVSVTNDYFDVVNVEYVVPGPVSVVDDVSFNKKVVRVSSLEHYTDVEAFIDVPESLTGDISVFWLESRVYLNFTGVDSDGDGLIEGVLFVIPHLSDQTFEISLNVLNVQSYPVLYGEWDVEFAVTGVDDLVVRGINTTFGSDLEFVGLYCGDSLIVPVVVNDSFVFSDFSCDVNVFFVSRELSVGVHHLEFMFGDKVAYAHNYAVNSLKFVSRRIIGSGGYIFKFLSTDAITNLSLNIFGLSIGTNNHTINCQEVSLSNYWECVWSGYVLGDYLLSSNATPSDELNITINVSSNVLSAFLSSASELTYVSGSSYGINDCVMIGLNGANLTRDYSPLFNDTFFNLTLSSRENLSLVLDYNSTSGINRTVFNLSSVYVNPSSAVTWLEAESLSVNGCSNSDVSCGSGNCTRFCDDTNSGSVNFTFSTVSGFSYLWLRTAIQDYGAALDIPSYYVSYFNGTGWSSEQTIGVGTTGADDGTVFEWDRINTTDASVVNVRIVVHDGLGAEYLFVDSLVFSNESIYDPSVSGNYAVNSFNVRVNSTGGVWQEGYFNSTLLGVVSGFNSPFRIVDARVCSLVSNSSGGFSYPLNISGSNNISVKAFYGDSYATKNFSIVNGVVFEALLLDSFGQSDLVVLPNESFNVSITATILGANISGINVTVNGTSYTATYLGGVYTRSLNAPVVTGNYNLSYDIYVGGLFNTSVSYVLRVRNLSFSFSTLGYVVYGSSFIVTANVSDGFDNAYIGDLSVDSSRLYLDNSATTQYSYDGLSWSTLDNGTYADVYLRWILNGSGYGSPYVYNLNNGSTIVDFNDSSKFVLNNTEVKNGRLQLIGANYFNNSFGDLSAGISFGSGSIFNKYYGSIMFDLNNSGSGTIFKYYADGSNWFNVTTDGTNVNFIWVGAGVSSSGSCVGSGLYVVNYGLSSLSVSLNGSNCLSLSYTEMDTTAKANISIIGTFGLNKLAVYDRNANVTSKFSTYGIASTVSRYSVSNANIVAFNVGRNVLFEREASSFGAQTINLSFSSTYGLVANNSLNVSAVADVYASRLFNYFGSDSNPMRFTTVWIDAELFDHSGLYNVSLFVDSGSGYSRFDTIVLNGRYDYVRFFIDTTPYPKDTVVRYYLLYYDNNTFIPGTSVEKNFTVMSPYRLSLSLLFASLLDTVDQFISGTFSRMSDVIIDLTYPNALSIVNETTFSGVSMFREDNSLFLSKAEIRVYDNLSGVKEELIQLDAGLVPDVNSDLWAYWPFESSNATKDASGHGKDLTYSSNPLVNDCHSSTCYLFNDTKYALFPSYSLAGKTTAISFWAKTPGASNLQAFGYGGAGRGIYLNYAGTGRPLIYLGLQTSRYFDLPQNYNSDSNWHNWIFVIPGINANDSLNWKLYVDGSEMSVYSTGVEAATSTALDTIGGAVQFFTGSMDDMRIYNSSLDYSQIRRLYFGPRSGRYTSPVFNISAGNLTFNNLTLNVTDSSTSTLLTQTRFSNDNITWSSWYPDVYDDNRIKSDTIFYSGFDNTAPYCVNNCSLLSQSNISVTTGVVNNATYFNGLTSYQSYNNSFISNLSTEGTIEFWLNPNATTSTQGILDTGKGIKFYTGQVPNVGLIAWWPLNGSAVDASGNGHNGTLFGNPAFVNSPTDLVKNSMLFDGGDDWINITNTAGLLSYNQTISLWIKSGDGIIIQYSPSGGTPALWSKYNCPSGCAPLLYLNGVNNQYFAPSSNGLYNSDWHNWVFVLRGDNSTQSSLYVDGVLQVKGSGSATDAAIQPTLFRIGAYPSSTFSGYLSNIRVYNRSLYDYEIKQLYYENAVSCWNGSDYIASVSTALPSNSWSNLAFSYTNKSSQLYLNGTLVSKSLTGCIINPFSNNITIGKAPIANSSLKYINNFSYYARGTNMFTAVQNIWCDGTYIYISDTGNNRIVKHLVPDLSYVSQVGTFGNGNDTFSSPYGSWSDGTYIYIADMSNNRIVKRWVSNFSYVSEYGTIGSGDNNLNTPYGVWGDGTYLYVLDYGNNRLIKRWASNLSYVDKIGSSGSGNDNFNYPRNIWGDGTYLYISDTGNHRVVKRLLNLSYVSQVGSNGNGNDQFANPRGIWGDGTYIYIADTTNNRIVKRNAVNLTYVDKIGTAGGGDDNFNGPYAVSGDGTYIYVVDYGNNRVVKRLLNLTYVSQLIATNGISDNYLNNPYDIWGDNEYLYILDTYNNRIIKRNIIDLSYVYQLGSYGTGLDQYSYPNSIWGDGTYLYLTDTSANRVFKRWASNLSYVAHVGSVAGAGPDTFNAPRYIWGDGTYIYISDYWNNRIVKRWAGNLSYVSQVGTTGSGNDQFNGPYGIWTDGTYLFIADNGNNRVVKRWAGNLSYVSQVSGLNAPVDIWGDINYIYVSDSGNHRVVKYNATSLGYVSSVGSLGTSINQFNTPRGLWGNNRYLYIVDSVNSRIVIRDLTDDFYFQGSIDSIHISNRSLERFELSYWNGDSRTTFQVPYSLSNSSSNYFQYRTILQKNDVNASTALLNVSFSYTDNTKYAHTGYAESNALELHDAFSFGKIFISKTETANVTEANVQVRIGNNNSGTVSWSSWIGGEPKNTPGTLLLETFESGSAYGNATDYSIEQGYNGYGLGLGYRNYAALSEGGNTSTSDVYVKGIGAYSSTDSINSNAHAVLTLDFNDVNNPETSGNYYNINLTNVNISNGLAYFDENSKMTVNAPAIENLKNDFAISITYNTSATVHQELFAKGISTSTDFPGVRVLLYANGTAYAKIRAMSQFNYLISVAADSNYVYISDNIFGNNVYKYHSSNMSSISRMIGSGIYTDIASDGTYLYGVSAYNAAVYKHRADDSTLISAVGIGSLQPTGVATDGTYVYTTNGANHTISKFWANNMTQIYKFGSYGSGNDQFNSPIGIFSDGNYVYVSDYGNHRIVKRNATDFSYVAQYGSAGSGNDQLSLPSGVWSDGAYIYVSDAGNARIVKRNASDLTYVSKFTTQGYTPGSIASPGHISGDGTYLYVADGYAGRIVKLRASNMSFVAQFGLLGVQKGDLQYQVAGMGGYYTPQGIYGDSTYFYVSDYVNERVTKRKLDDMSLALIGPNYDYSLAAGLWVDNTYIYVADRNNHRIAKRWANNLSYVANVGSLGSGTNNFNTPYDVWGDGTYLYIADFLNNRIMKRLASNMSVYVAQNGSLGSDNESFNGPMGIWGDGTYLYITDYYNHRVIKRWASNLSFVAQNGSLGTGNYNFNNPTGIWGDSNGSIYIADMNNHRVVKRRTSDLGYVSQIGLGSVAAGETGLNRPLDVWSDGTYLYVADSQNIRITKYYMNDFSYVDETETGTPTCRGGAVAPGQFHNIIVSVYKGNFSLYVDGNLVCNQYFNSSYNLNVLTSSFLKIGQNYHFRGQIDDIKILKLNDETNLTQLAQTLSSNINVKPEVQPSDFPFVYYRSLNTTRTVNRIRTVFPNDTVQYYSIYLSNLTNPASLVPVTLDKRAIWDVSSDNNWVKYRTGSSIFTDPKSTGTLFTQAQYGKIRLSDSNPFYDTQSTEGYRTVMFVAFNLSEYNLSKFSRIRLKAYGYGSGWNGAAENFGLNISVWNFTASDWSTLNNGSQNISMMLAGDISSSSGFSDVIDTNKTLFMMITPSYPANTLNSVSSRLVVDYVALTLTPSTAFITSDWTEVIGNRPASGEVIDSFTPRQAKWIGTVMKTGLTNWDFSEPGSNSGLADGWSSSYEGTPVFVWNNGIQKIICDATVPYFQCGIRQSFSWDPSKNYTIELRVKENGPFAYGVHLRTCKDCYPSFPGAVNNVPITTSWATYTYNVTPFNNGSSTPYFFITAAGSGVSNLTWLEFDYIKVYPQVSRIENKASSINLYSQEIYDAGQVSYNATRYVNSTQGTIEFWAKPKLKYTNYVDSAQTIFHLDDMIFTSGANVADSSKRNISGNIVGQNGRSITGVINNSIYFCGACTSASHRINVSNISAGYKGITFAGWFYLNSFTDYQALFYSPAPYFFLSYSLIGNRMLAAYSTNGTGFVNVFSNSGYPVVSQWIFVTVVFDYASNQVIYYKNGIRFGNSSAMNSTYPQIYSSMSIGGTSTGAYSFNGSIDEVYIFNTSLSDTEIYSLYSRSNFVQTNGTRLLTAVMNSTQSEWHHYAFTYNNSIPQYTLWKDGSVQETINAVFNTSNATTLLFENQEFQSNYVLDNLHTSNYPKSQYELDYYQGLEDNSTILSSGLLSTSQLSSEGNLLQYRTILRTRNSSLTPTLSSVSWNLIKTLQASVSCGPFCYIYNYTLNLPTESPLGLYSIIATGIGDDENATNTTSFNIARNFGSVTISAPDNVTRYYVGDSLNISMLALDQFSRPIPALTPILAVLVSESRDAYFTAAHTWDNNYINTVLGSNITIFNDYATVRTFNSDLFNATINSGDHYTFYVDTPGIHTVTIAGGFLLTINVSTSNVRQCANPTSSDNGIVECIMDTSSLTTPYTYNLLVNLTKTNYNPYYNIFHGAFKMYSKGGELTIYPPTEIVVDTDHYNFNTTLIISNTGGTLVSGILPYNKASQGFAVTLVENNCTTLDIYENCTAVFNIVIPSESNIQDYYLLWRTNFTDLEGAKDPQQFTQLVSILQNPGLDSNVTGINLSLSHNTQTAVSFTLNTSGNVNLQDISLTYVSTSVPSTPLNVTFTPLEFLFTYMSTPEYFNVTVNVPYRQYAGDYYGYLNISGTSVNTPYPRTSLIIPINITILADHNYTITPSSLDVSHQLNIPAVISTFTLDNFGNVNESLIFNISQRGTDYTDVTNASNPAIGTIYNLPIGGQTSFSLSHKEYYTPQDFYFNVTIGAAKSNITLRIKDMPPILGSPTIVNPPAELGAQSRISFTMSDEQPGTVTLTCNYTIFNGTANVSSTVTATNYLDRKSCVFTPTIEGTYNVFIKAVDNGAQSSNISLSMPVIGSTRLNVTATSAPHAYNIGLYDAENVTINISIVNIGNASGLNINVTTGSYVLTMQSINLSRNQTVLAGINLTLPAGTLASDINGYAVPIVLSWQNRNGSTSNTTFIATVYVHDNPITAVVGIPTNPIINHGTEQNYTINISNYGNADLADLVLSEIFNPSFNITFYDLAGERINSLSVISVGGQAQFVMRISALLGASGNTLTEVNVTSSNADTVYYPLTVSIPQSFSYSTLNNISIVDAYGQDKTIFIPINNTGNINKVFTFEIQNLTNVTTNTTLTINKQTSKNLSFNYITPDYDANISGYLNVSYGTGYDLIPIYIRTIPASFNLINISHTQINKITDAQFNFTANMTISDVLITDNLTFSAFFSSYECQILNSAYNATDGLWYVSCQVPSELIDGTNHTLIISATELSTGITLDDSSRSVYFFDTTPPTIINVTTGVQIDGLAIDIGVTAIDNVNITNASLFIPRTNETFGLIRIDDYYSVFGGIVENDLGDYDAIFMFNDADNNSINYTVTFGIYKLKTFQGTLKDYTNTAFVTRFSFYDPLRNSSTIFNTNVNGFYSQGLYAKPYNINIQTRNYELQLNNASLMNASTSFITLDEIPKNLIPLTTVVTGSKGFIIKTKLNAAGSIIINYSALSIENEPFLEVMRCSNWNETAFECDDAWWSQLPKSKDVVNKLITATVSELSPTPMMYILVENVPAPAPIIDLDNSNPVYTVGTGVQESLSLSINSAGEEGLRNVHITCSSALCSVFNFSSTTIPTINPLTPNVQMPFTVFIPKGYAAGWYSVPVTIESNANPVSATLNFNVPESTALSITPTTNISLDTGTAMTGTLTTLTIENIGNIDATLTSTATHDFITFPDDDVVHVLESKTYPVTYKIPDTMGTYAGNININNISINYQITVTSNMTLMLVQPSSGLRGGDTLNRIDFNVYNHSILMTNDTLQSDMINISVWGMSCPVTSTSYTSYFELRCTLPDIGMDMPNYTLRIQTPFAAVESQIYYEDRYGPYITSIDSSMEKSDTTYINFSLYDSTGIGPIAIVMTYDTGSRAITNIVPDPFTPLDNVIIDLGSGNYRIKTSANDIDDYTLAFTMSDTNGFGSTFSKPFEIYEYKNLSGSVRDISGEYVPALFRFYNTQTGSLVSSLQHSGFYSVSNMHKRDYRMYIESFDGKAKVWLDSVDLRTDLSDLLNMSELDLAKVGVSYSEGNTLDIYGVAVETTISSPGNLSLTFDPSDYNIQNTQNVQMFRCDDFDYVNAVCNVDFEQLNSTKSYNLDGTQTLTTLITGFSAYLLTELRPEGSTVVPTVITTGDAGGGGGGGGGNAAIAESLNYIRSSLNSSLNSSNLQVDANEIKREMYIGETTTAKIRLTNPKNDSMSIKFGVSEDLSKFINFSKSEITLGPREETVVEIQIHAGYDTKKGLYTGAISLSSDLGVKTLPVELRVYESSEFATSITVELINPRITPGNPISAQFGINYPSSIPTNFSYSIEAYDSFKEERIYSESGFMLIDGPINIFREINTSKNTPLGSYVLKIALSESARKLDYKKTATFDIVTPFLERKLFGLKLLYFLYGLESIAGIFLLIFAYRGIKKYRESLKRYHLLVDRRELPEPGDNTIFVGNLAETEVRTFFEITQMRTHTIIAGTTGGGKSVTAQVFVEEALDKNVGVIVFDPTAQWSGFLRKLNSKQMMKLYEQFGMKPADAKSFNGNVYNIEDPLEIVEIKKHIQPGEIHIFTTQKLTPAQMDIFVANTVRQVFVEGFNETPNLRGLIVYDEVHRLLPKFGGSGEGFLQIERACREFRKWGLGVVLISQVLSDFVGEIKANITTEIQMRTRDEGDLERLKSKYGEELLQALVKTVAGTGMLENPSYNKGRPYLITFRPLKHSIERLSDADLALYNKYNSILDDYDYQIEQLQKLNYDTFDLELEHKLSMQKVKSGQFNMVDIYLESLVPAFSAAWKSLNKVPKKREKKLADIKDVRKSIQDAQKAREKTIKEEKVGASKVADVVSKDIKNANVNVASSVNQNFDDSSSADPNSEGFKEDLIASTANTSPIKPAPNVSSNSSTNTKASLDKLSELNVKLSEAKSKGDLKKLTEVFLEMKNVIDTLPESYRKNYANFITAYTTFLKLNNNQNIQKKK